MWVETQSYCVDSPILLSMAERTIAVAFLGNSNFCKQAIGLRLAIERQKSCLSQAILVRILPTTFHPAAQKRQANCFVGIRCLRAAAVACLKGLQRKWCSL